MTLAQTRADPEWTRFSWPSTDILTPKEIESALRWLDPVIFQQEYLGQFISAQGRAFGTFDPAVHVQPTAYEPALHLCWSLDFNINPMCSGIIQYHRGAVRVIDELSLANTDTDSACNAFLELAQRRGWDLRNAAIYGDASGSARDSIRALASDPPTPGIRFRHVTGRHAGPLLSSRAQGTSIGRRQHYFVERLRRLRDCDAAEL